MEIIKLKWNNGSVSTGRRNARIRYSKFQMRLFNIFACNISMQIRG